MPLPPPPPAPIDPEEVPNRCWLVFEDALADRWMVPGVADVCDSDGSETIYAVDDGSGGPVYLGLDTGVLYFRLDLTAGLVSGVTGPELDVALPADTATELYFQIATITSATPGDFVQVLEGPFRWQNSGQPGKWGTEPVIFTNGGTEIARIYFDRGMPVPVGGGLSIDVAAAGPAFPAVLTGAASAGTFTEALWDKVSEDAFHVSYWGNVDPNWRIYLDRATGDAELYYLGAAATAIRPGTGTSITGVFVATAQGEIDFNGGSGWSYTLS